MLKSKLVVASLMALVVAGGSLIAGSDSNKLEGVKCIMNAKKAASAEKASKWKDGKVYFCCDGCLGKFEKMDKKKKAEIAHKANHQLVASKQYEQTACPFSGGDLNKETKIKVNGAEIAFCCGNCKAKAEKAEGDEQVKSLFGDKAFEKAKFKLVKREKK